MKKFIISSGILKPALAKLGQAIIARPILPVLSNIYVRVTEGQAEFITSNTEITIYHRLVCESKEAFEFLIPFDLFSNVVALNKNCPLQIEAGKKIKVTGPDDVYELKIDAKIETFPKLQEVPKDKSFEISSEILQTLHKATSTTAKAEKLPALANVLMELSPGKLTIASSDGAYSVFSKEFELDQQDMQELLISQRLIKVLESGMDDVKVFYNDGAIGFEAGDITIINTRTENKFVNFRKVFPEDWPANLTVSKDRLLEALGKCSLSNDDLKKTKISFDVKGLIKLSADDSRIDINLKIPGEYTGELPETAVNSEKLLKLLHQIEEDSISMAIHDARRAIIITVETDPGYKGMLMPIAF